MTHEEEAVAMTLVLERLTTQYPDRPPGEAEAAVNHYRARLTGPVREFVPLLVGRFVMSGSAISAGTPTSAERAACLGYRLPLLLQVTRAASPRQIHKVGHQCEETLR